MTRDTPARHNAARRNAARHKAARNTAAPNAAPDAAVPPPRLRLARVALGLYPPTWRDRYGDEVLALLADSGGGARAVASLAWHAVPAWICPPRHLHADRPARMRASIGTVLVAWSILAGLGLVFDQLTQQQGVVPPIFSYQRWATPRSHMIWVSTYSDIVTWAYRVFDVAMVGSALAIAVGGLPLWLVTLRRAWRGKRRRDLAGLLMPLLAPASYLAAVLVATTALHRPGGVSPSWFLAFVLAGFAAAIAAAAGPGLALRSLRPGGPAVGFAARAAAVGVASMCVAALSSGTAAVTLYLFASGPGNLLTSQSLRAYEGSGLALDPQYASTAMLVGYLALVTAAAAVAIVSASRGARAALAEHGWTGLVRR
jgi:hypothetical protein